MTREEAHEYRQLESLADSDYEMADGNPEIQGWDIKDDEGNRVGKSVIYYLIHQARRSGTLLQILILMGVLLEEF